MAELANCPKCGGVFVKALRSVCEKCAREVETQFDTVYRFIRKRDNRRADINEVVEATEVPKEQIFQFIREGRILVSQFPNLSYPCESCGADIKDGRLCDSCKGNIQSGLKQHDSQKAFEERKVKEENGRVTAYHSLDDRVNRRR